MRAVNLLPADAYVAKPKLPHAPVVLAATVPVLAGALVYLGYSLEHPKVTDRKTTLSVMQSQVDALTPSQALVSQASQVATQRRQRQLELSDALAMEQPWDVALDQIGRVLPANTWLTSVTAASPTQLGGGGTGATWSLQGYTMTLDDVATVITRLSLVPSLSDVQLNGASASVIGNKNVTQFSITATAKSVTP
jgi:Tfp pilus assembly protein PilN